MTKKLLSLVLCCLLLLSSFGTCSAASITEDELTELQTIFDQLDSTTMQQSANWIELKKQLEISKQLTNNLQKQVIDYQKLTTDLTNSLNKTGNELLLTKNELTEANKSFKEFEKEAKKEIRKLRFQRDLCILGIIAGGYLATK